MVVLPFVAFKLGSVQRIGTQLLIDLAGPGCMIHSFKLLNCFHNKLLSSVLCVCSGERGEHS